MIFRLREILKERQISIAQFSTMCGISQSNISNYMCGKISPTLETLNKIADSLDIDITELFKKQEDIVFLVKIDDTTYEIDKEELIKFIKEKYQQNGHSERN